MRMVRVVIGELYCHEMPHSEVCVHMQVAGKFMYFRVLPGGRAVQLLEPRGPIQSMYEFSAPILPGEAGLYTDASGLYFNATDARPLSWTEAPGLCADAWAIPVRKPCQSIAELAELYEGNT